MNRTFSLLAHYIPLQGPSL